MKKTLLLIVIITLLQSFTSFAQTTVYDVREVDLQNVNAGSCSTSIRYVNDGDWGFSWTSTDTGRPTRITVELDFAVNCDSHPTKETVRLNDVPQGSQPTPGPYFCECYPGTARTTWTLNPDDYNAGGLNTVLIKSYYNTEGLNVIPEYANAYARVTVYYGIDIEGLGNSIPNEDITPIADNGTEYGSVSESAIVDHTFVIQNEGVADLVFTATPHVTISGSNAFSIQEQPVSARVVSGASAPFVVRFAPTCDTLGVQTAVVSVASDNPSLNNYTFTVQGTGSHFLPTVVTQNIKVKLDAAGNAIVNAIDLNNGSTHSCGTATYTMTIGTTGTICESAYESGNVVLTAPEGSLFTAVNFASYGTPIGSCGSFSIGMCNASESLNVVSSYLIGKNAAIIPATNGVFGDPCNGTGKILSVQAGYSPSEVSLTTKTFTCADIGDHTIYLTVTDGNGNSATAAAIVTVEDIIQPTVVTQNAVIQLNKEGQATVTADQINNGSSDNCSIASVTVSPSTFTCEDLGDNIVTLTVTDVTGNENTATAVVTVQDTIVPIFGIPATGIIPEILYYKFDGSGTSIPNLVATPPVGSENAIINGVLTQNTAGICGTGSLVGSGNSSSSDYVNTNWNTNLNSDWTISFKTSNIPASTNLNYVFGDINAGQFRCFTGGVAGPNNWILRGPFSDVTVNDGATMEPHTITFVYSQTAGNIKAYVDGVLKTTVAQGAIAISSTSNFKIGGYSSGAGLSAGGLLDEFGIYNRSLSAEEVAQLSDCPIAATTTDLDNVSLENTAGTCGVAYTYVTPTAYDNCTFTLTQTSGLASGEIFPIGTTTNTFVATDAAGNETTSSFDVTVLDVISPTALAQNITVELDAAGTVSVTGSQIDNESYDNCTIASMTVSPNAFSCADIGTNDVILTVTDTSGNSSTAMATVTVQDVTAPTVLIQDIIVQLNAVGTVSIVPSQINNGSFDNCGIASITVSPDTFTISDIGENEVTLTVTDNNGLSSSEIAVVTVNSFFVNTITRNSNTLTADESSATTYQWMTCNGGIYVNIPSEESPSYTPTAVGSYSVDITKNGSTRRSDCIDFTALLGNNDFDINSKLSVYPNPFHDVISINVDANAKMEIYNLLGESIYEQKINSGSTLLNLSNHANGVYLMKITTENDQSNTVKIMKK